MSWSTMPGSSSMVLTTYVGSGSPALRTFPAGLTHTVAAQLGVNAALYVCREAVAHMDRLTRRASCCGTRLGEDAHRGFLSAPRHHLLAAHNDQFRLGEQGRGAARLQLIALHRVMAVGDDDGGEASRGEVREHAGHLRHERKVTHAVCVEGGLGLGVQDLECRA
eukprot:CAMPEP_0181365490 /NCGR_PEP_ID=MMETSP1106-20121128/10099_1 /TAXON_ID=81844 /ORGANISM="Mantoniella antarctica, Strain SL-175" /LENGTH=164 /DNA_ID=CAMNT_0023480577 /DNA_START=199 /DNA_END=692 /DNA_ORIENTATION=-